jgi:hypothetical protein
VPAIAGRARGRARGGFGRARVLRRRIRGVEIRVHRWFLAPSVAASDALAKVAFVGLVFTQEIGHPWISKRRDLP